eukprot:Rmarinus@m.15761
MVGGLPRAVDLDASSCTRFYGVGHPFLTTRLHMSLMLQEAVMVLAFVAESLAPACRYLMMSLYICFTEAEEISERSPLEWKVASSSLGRTKAPCTYGTGLLLILPQEQPLGLCVAIQTAVLTCA